LLFSGSLLVKGGFLERYSHRSWLAGAFRIQSDPMQFTRHRGGK